MINIQLSGNKLNEIRTNYSEIKHKRETFN